MPGYSSVAAVTEFEADLFRQLSISQNIASKEDDDAKGSLNDISVPT